MLCHLSDETSDWVSYDYCHRVYSNTISVSDSVRWTDVKIGETSKKKAYRRNDRFVVYFSSYELIDVRQYCETLLYPANDYRSDRYQN